MSLAVQLTSDKSRFANYFSDPLILSKNTEIAVSKCSGSIPTIVTQTITVPYIPVEELDNIMLTAIVDSVELLITWRDFYEAWDSSTNNIEEPTVPAGGVTAFYGGNYELYLNNQISVIDANDNIFNKLSFEELLIDALNDKYEFYTFRNESKYVSGRLNEVFANTTWTNPYQLAPIPPYKATRIKNMTLDTFKITATYNADAISLKTPTSIDFTLYPNQVTGWTAAGNTLTNPTGNEALAVVNPFYKIDRNGGFVQWKYTHTGTGMESTYAGLIETAAEVNVVAAVATPFNPSIACLSVKYASRAESTDTFIIQEYGVDKSLPITYAANNFIFMRCFRTNDVGPEKNSFVLQVWKGNSGTLLPNTLIYSSNISLQNNYSPQPFFYDDGQGGAIGSVFSAVRYIPEGEQTAQQNSSLGSSAAEQNTFSLSSAYITLGRGDDFFTQIGIPDASSTVGLGQTVSESDQNALQHSLSWKPQIDRRYEYKYLGLPSGPKFTTGVINNLIISPNADGTIKWSRNNQWYVKEIPRMFEFHIQDVSVKNYEGSYIAGAQNYTTGSISKCVGTISVPREYFSKIDNFNLDFDYEPFSMIYRQINNPDNFTINMMNCNFSYKDFYSNKLNPIDSLNGTLKTELHFRVQDEAQRGKLNNQIKPN